MSKTKKVKAEYEDTSEILDLVSILKDIATTLFFQSLRKREGLADFVGCFKDFFKMANFVGANHPLVNPPSQAAAVFALTSESPFMGDMNSKVIRAAAVEVEKNNASEIIVIGNKSYEKARLLFGRSKNIKAFTDLFVHGKYRMSVMIKDHITQLVLGGKTGRVVAVYPVALNINIVKAKTAFLFPTKELLEQQQQVEPITEEIIMESSVNEVLGYLASVWLSCRIYELFMHSDSAVYAAQTQQLDGACDRLKKDKMMLALTLKKARKAEISKNIAEVFAASMLTKKH